MNQYQPSAVLRKDGYYWVVTDHTFFPDVYHCVIYIRNGVEVGRWMPPNQSWGRDK